MDTRPPIPADIRRRVLVEAGHRCAIPTCRYIECDVHHIIPWAQCQTHEYDNLIALCPNCHRRTHDGGDIDRKSLRLYKFNLRFAHDKFSQLEMDILFELNKIPSGQGIMWPPFMHILLKRLIDSNYIQIIEQSGGVFIGGMKTNPDHLIITPSGRTFLSELGLHEM